MHKIKNLVAGLAGAVALNLLHETLKKESKQVPRVDLLGEEAVQKVVRYFGGNITNRKELYQTTLAGDILSNALYYSLIGAGDSKSIWPKAIAMGVTAGIGAITLPEPMGLDPKPVAKNNQIKAMTIGYYVFGAIVTGLVLKLIRKT